MDHPDQKVFRDGTDILHHGDIHPEYMLRSFFIASQNLPWPKMNKYAANYAYNRDLDDQLWKVLLSYSYFDCSI